jgi:predicted  nucleic acid-binding Zn-ribbon protein
LHQINRVRSHLVELQEQADKNREAISAIFAEVRAKITERESQIKKKIAETLEQEHKNLKSKISSFELQLESIKALKEE